jgi:hypothetical protein
MVVKCQEIPVALEGKAVGVGSAVSGRRRNANGRPKFLPVAGERRGVICYTNFANTADL